MSTTEEHTKASDSEQSAPRAASGRERARSAAESPSPDTADADDSARGRSSSGSMREGAMARVSPRRDLSSRRPGPSRSAGVAGGSAAGASAGRGQSSGAEGTRSASSGGKPRRTGPRRVRLTIQRVDPWSVFKISLLVAVGLGIAMVITVAVLWTVLSGMNVFATINEFIAQVTSGEDSATAFDLMEYIGLGRVLSLTVVFAVANVLLLTALATLSAFLYNVCAALVGGAHLTLSDE
ncbi:MAG: DUF3566 domain-containing protein [Ornithinimicrobium sp.]